MDLLSQNEQKMLPCNPTGTDKPKKVKTFSPSEHFIAKYFNIS